jgi:hypothetical protein
MPYICLAQNLPDGSVQILDLKPNASQRSLIYEPNGQTQYVNRVQDTVVPFDTAGVTTTLIVGLSAYLVDRVEPAGGSWGPTEQATVAAGLVARMDGGLGLTLAEVNVVIQATFGGSDLDGAGSSSTGNLRELLSILAGRSYALGVGWVKGPGGAWDIVQRGAFTRAVRVSDPDLLAPTDLFGVDVPYEYKPIVHTVESSAFNISLVSGNLSVLAGGVDLFPDSEPSAFHGQQFQQPGPQVAEIPNARVVSVYADDGALLA